MADSQARGETGEVSGEAESDLKARLAVAEDRLDFYASFDRLIQDNVAQAGRLMRDALELRERTQAELDLAKAQAEERFAAERGRYRIDLETVHADLIALQATAASMARRVAATIGAMNTSADQVAAGSRPGLPLAVAAAAVAGSTGTVRPVDDGAVVGEPDEAEAAVAALGSGDQPHAAETPLAKAEADAATIETHVTEGSGDGDAGFSAGEIETESGRPEPAEPVVDAVGPDDQAAAAPAEPAAESAPAFAAGLAPSAEDVQPAQSAQLAPPGDAHQADDVGEVVGSRSVTVLVHGVPRAAAALALQRHLHGLRHVESVEAREYAEGVLRLHVVTGGRLALEDLQGWDGGAGLQPVTLSGDVLEVRLPGAQGF